MTSNDEEFSKIVGEEIPEKRIAEEDFTADFVRSDAPAVPDEELERVKDIDDLQLIASLIKVGLKNQSVVTQMTIDPQFAITLSAMIIQYGFRRA